MAQRISGYGLVPNETYITPDWVWNKLYEEFPRFQNAKDPFPANSEKDAFESQFPYVFASNPPFSRSDEIVKKALNEECVFALLLPVTWDCAKSRILVCQDLFAKIILTKRIRWENLEQKKNGPSSNHAWYVWETKDWEDTPYLIYA